MICHGTTISYIPAISPPALHDTVTSFSSEVYNSKLLEYPLSFL